MEMDFNDEVMIDTIVEEVWFLLPVTRNKLEVIVTFNDDAENPHVQY